MTMNYMLAVKYFTMCMAVMESSFEEVCNQSPIPKYIHIDFDRIKHIKCTHDDFRLFELYTYDLNIYDYQIFRYGRYKYTFERYLRIDSVDRPTEYIGQKSNTLEIKFYLNKYIPEFVKEIYSYRGVLVNYIALSIMFTYIDFRSIISLTMSL